MLDMAEAPAQAAPELDLRLVVHRVEGVAPGLYRYLPGERGLEQLEARSLAGPLERACLFQDKAGSAAVAFLVVGEIAAARARAGERSYRDLLLQAGALAQRIYLAAEAIDLGARNLAALLRRAPERAREARRARARRRAPHRAGTGGLELAGGAPQPARGLRRATAPFRTPRSRAAPARRRRRASRTSARSRRSSPRPRRPARRGP